METNLTELKRKYDESANFIQRDILMENSEAIPIMHKIIETRKELVDLDPSQNEPPQFEGQL